MCNVEEQESIEPAADTQELRAELRELKRQVSELRSRADVPDPGMTLANYDLPETEALALRLISLGLNQTQTSQLVWRSDDYVKRRLHDSAAFAHAYQDVREEFNVWQEARLKFALPQVWREIDAILGADLDAYRDEDNDKYAIALLKAKTAVIDKVLRHNYAMSSEVKHSIDVDIPALQLAASNMELIASHLQKLALAETRGELEGRLPESKIIDLTPEETALRFNKQPHHEDGRFRCLECGHLVRNLKSHLSLQHNVELQQYIVLHNLDPLEKLDN